MKKVIIIDTSAIIYRSNFAYRTLTSKDGIKNGAIYGLVKQIEQIIKVFSPDYVVATMDVSRSTLERTKSFEDYKAHRKPMPEELKEQMEDIKEVIKGYDIPIFAQEGYEADDFIATLAERFMAYDDTLVYIVTADKDLSQLVLEGRVHIALLNRDEKPYKYLVTDEDVKDYIGVYPRQIPDYFGLIGDASDGIPGIKGIGSKKAIPLIEEYDTLENIFDNIDNIKVGKADHNRIKEGQEIAITSRMLATVKRDIEIDFDLEKMKLNDKKYDILEKVYKKRDLRTYLMALKKEEMELKLQDNILEIKNATIDKQNVLKNTIFITPDRFIDILKNNKVSIYEDEIGIAILLDNKVYTYIKEEDVNIEDILNENIKEKINIEYINAYSIKKYLKVKNMKIKDFSDISLKWYVLETEEKDGIDNVVYLVFDDILSGLQKKYSDKDVEMYEKGQYLGERVIYIKKLNEKLNVKLKENNLDDIYNNIEKKLAPVLSKMEMNGIKIDINYFEKFKKELIDNIYGLERTIYLLAGEEFNIASPKQLSNILFEKLGIKPIKKTKTGYSTDIEVLEMLSKRGIEIADKIFKYRFYAKLLSTYVESMLTLVDENDLIHTNFNQNATATGRLSSTNPNLQNIPARTEDGIRVRSGFISNKNTKLVSFDYSQIELRVLAELSKDQRLIEAYNNDIDLHELTAKKLFGKENINKEERNIAKTINFSVLYGKSPFGLSKELGISMSEAKGYIDKYFEEYPEVRRFLDKIVKFAEENGYVETFFGTRRYIKNINNTNKNLKSRANRMAVNTVVQGTAANVIKKVMIELENYCNKDIRMLVQVHDELLFEISINVLDEAIKNIKEIMENTVIFDDVSLKTNMIIGDNWGELK